MEQDPSASGRGQDGVSDTVRRIRHMDRPGITGRGPYRGVYGPGRGRGGADSVTGNLKQSTAGRTEDGFSMGGFATSPPSWYVHYHRLLRCW